MSELAMETAKKMVPINVLGSKGSILPTLLLSVLGKEWSLVDATREDGTYPSVHPLLGMRCFLDWPHLKEAKIVAKYARKNEAAVCWLSPVHSPLPRPSMESSIRPLLDTEPSLNT